MACKIYEDIVKIVQELTEAEKNLSQQYAYDNMSFAGGVNKSDVLTATLNAGTMSKIKTNVQINEIKPVNEAVHEEKHLQKKPQILIDNKHNDDSEENAVGKSVVREKELWKTPIFIFVPHRTNLTDKFLDEFLSEMRGRGIVLQKLQHVIDTEMLFQHGLLFLVCTFTSRCKTDIDNCLKDINSLIYDRVILVCLHVRKEKQLPTVYTGEKMRTWDSYEKYKTIYKIIDIAYTRSGGLFACSMNENAFQELEHFSANHHVQGITQHVQLQQEVDFDSYDIVSTVTN